ncbi:aspartate/tyrosine/aromatic aminotransferase [Mesotoga sp. SC_4PWA21]|nr:aspartate/tyrosine/aromatic aminotransferase [Mesotoga sp. SC_4PWA21]
MKLNDFKLEVYFEKHEFDAPYLLAQSDCEAMTIGELLKMDGEPASKFMDTWLGYTEVPGNRDLRVQIARLYSTVEMEEVLVHSGAEEAIYNFMNVFLQKGDHVICQFPVYQSLYEVANAIGCEVTRWELRRSGEEWSFDVDELKDLVRPETKLLVINNPNNPTGYLVSNRDLMKIASFTEERGIFVFSDEVYRGLELDKSIEKQKSFADISDNSLALGVMSKSYGLAGLRIGWVVSHNKSVLKSMTRFKHYTTICNSAPSEYLAWKALCVGDKILKRNRAIVVENWDRAALFFEKHSSVFRVSRPKAGPIAFIQFVGGDVDRFCSELLDNSGVLLLPGSMYDYEGGYFRMGFGRKSFAEGLNRLDEFLDSSDK